MKKVLALLFFLAVFLGGCSVAPDQENNLPMKSYTSENGYTLDLPADWVKAEETIEKTEFVESENQLSMSITSELGGVDYFSMNEIKDQLSGEIAEEILVGEYEVIGEETDAIFFRQVLSGVDNNEARITVDIFAAQPYNTMRHYLVIVASDEAYQTYLSAIEEMLNSFTIILNEEEYLQLMDERRIEAAEESAQNETEESDSDSTNE